MKKIRMVIIAMVFVAVMTAVFVGCTEKQYFEQGTKVGFQKRYGEYTIVFEFDENSLGEEYAKKYRNFCKEEGIAAKEELMNDSTVYGTLRMIIGGQASSYTLKSVSEVPSTTQVVYFNGRKGLGKGEILVHKWTYYTLLANTYGFYINDDLAKKILDSDDVLSKYIALLECHVIITELGMSVDYYGCSSVLDEKIGKKEIPLMLYEHKKETTADTVYKEYVVAGYYIDEADYDYLDIVYDKEQFSSLTSFMDRGITKKEREIRKKLDEIENAFYVR